MARNVAGGGKARDALYHTLPAGRAERAFSEGGERMVNQEDSFDLDKLLKSQKTLSFLNILLN